MSGSSSTTEAIPGHIPQILFVGKSQVGKSSLIRKVSGREIDRTRTSASIGEDYVEKSIKLGRHPKQQLRKIRLFDQPFDMGGSPTSILRCVSISIADYVAMM
eukprot:TRINITY_DN2475_c0_g2_i1.p1 TRINITY_DN2475_c0_g2~~TRINITY_DN2475_c0_g2_i1.p1  ORF type:complete len:103 (-),score=16.84 TRINITY_DN2475_c0_g2_i1:70-378(-)